MKKILSYFLLLIFTLSMPGNACAEAGDITGTWYANTYGKVLTLNINEGGIYTMEMMDEAMIGTWVLENNILYVDKGTIGEKIFNYDVAAQTLDGNGRLFTRNPISAFDPGNPIAAGLEEFTGNWIATNVDSISAALPFATAQFHMNITIEGTKVILTIEFTDKETQEGEAVFSDGALHLTIPAADENDRESTYIISMLDTGMISVSTELTTGPAIFYCSAM